MEKKNYRNFHPPDARRIAEAKFKWNFHLNSMKYEFSTSHRCWSYEEAYNFIALQYTSFIGVVMDKRRTRTFTAVQKKIFELIKIKENV